MGQFLKSFILWLFAFIFILFIGNIMQLSNLIINQKIGLISSLKLLTYLLLPLASYALPMAALLGSLMSLGRLSLNNEISAMKSSGISPFSIALPVLTMGLLLTAICLKLNDTVLPNITHARRQLISKIARKCPASIFEEGTLIEAFKGYVIYVKRVKKNKLLGVYITRLSEDGGPPTNIIAKTGLLLTQADSNTISLKLKDVTMDKIQEAGRLERGRYNVYYLNLELPPESEQPGKRLKDMSIAELNSAIVKFKGKKMDTALLFAEINRKLSLAFSALSLTLLGAPLGLKRMAKRKVNFGAGFLIILLYYIIFAAGEGLSTCGITPGVVWLPNILAGGAGCLILWKTSHI